MRFVRVYRDDRCGLFLALEPHENLERVVAAIETSLDG